MNLRRQAIEYFSTTRPSPRFDAVFAHSIKVVGTGVSFLLPYGGYLFEADKEASISLADTHLPFQSCVLEWTKSEGDFGEVDVVCMIREFEEHFEVSSTARFSGTWVPVVLILKVPRSSTIDTYWGDGEFKNRVCLEPIVLSPFAPADMLDGKNYLHELKVAAQFLLAASCGNVKPVKLAEPSEQQRKAAERRGNPPFDTYWTLDCSLDGPADAKKITNGGHHGSPRLHVRRGHVRRLPTGKMTWVRQSLVGNPERGIADKEYRLPPTVSEPPQ